MFGMCCRMNPFFGFRASECVSAVLAPLLLIKSFFSSSRLGDSRRGVSLEYYERAVQVTVPQHRLSRERGSRYCTVLYVCRVNVPSCASLVVPPRGLWVCVLPRGQFNVNVNVNTPSLPVWSIFSSGRQKLMSSDPAEPMLEAVPAAMAALGELLSSYEVRRAERSIGRRRVLGCTMPSSRRASRRSRQSTFVGGGTYARWRCRRA